MPGPDLPPWEIITVSHVCRVMCFIIWTSYRKQANIGSFLSPVKSCDFLLKHRSTAPRFHLFLSFTSKQASRSSHLPPPGPLAAMFGPVDLAALLEDALGDDCLKAHCS